MASGEHHFFSSRALTYGAAQNAVDATAFLTNRGPDLLAAPAAWLAW